MHWFMKEGKDLYVCTYWKYTWEYAAVQGKAPRIRNRYFSKRINPWATVEWSSLGKWCTSSCDMERNPSHGTHHKEMHQFIFPRRRSNTCTSGEPQRGRRVSVTPSHVLLKCTNLCKLVSKYISPYKSVSQHSLAKCILHCEEMYQFMKQPANIHLCRGEACNNAPQGKAIIAGIVNEMC